MLIALAGGYLDIPHLNFDTAETGGGGATGIFSIQGINPLSPPLRFLQRRPTALHLKSKLLVQEN
jgi:hypothetical protein